MAKQKNAGGDMSGNLILLGVLGVAGYFVYEMFFAAPATASTAPASTTPASTTTATTPTATAAPATPAAAPSTSTGSTTAAGSALNAIYTAMLNLIVQYQDTTNFTNVPASGNGPSTMVGTPYHFNTYLAMAASGYTVPDPSVVFGSVAAASQPISAASYWADMGPALAAANPSLSGGGLGCYAGVGAYLRGMGAYRW